MRSRSQLQRVPRLTAAMLAGAAALAVSCGGPVPWDVGEPSSAGIGSGRASVVELSLVPSWLDFQVDHDGVRRRSFFVSALDRSAVRERLGQQVRLSRADFFEAVREERAVSIAFRTLAPGKHGAIHLVVHFEPDGVVRRVWVISHREVRGRAAMEAGYLSRYRGMSAADPVSLGVDVDALTGATVTSRALTRAVKLSATLFSRFYERRRRARRDMPCRSTGMAPSLTVATRAKGAGT